MKSFIKNNLKIFVSIIMTAIIVGSVSVYAASQYLAKDISFTPTNDNFKKENGEPIENVEDALNELYNKKNNTLKTGEAFLLNASKTLKLQHNYTPYGAYFDISDLDFDNIKNFTYSYELTTTNSAYQELALSSNDVYYLRINSSTSGICEINGASNVNFSWAVANENIGKFKVISYTKMDGTIINFN